MRRQQAMTTAPEGAFPVLPAGMQREDVTKLLRTVRRALGFKAARLDALFLMMDSTRPSDWTDPSVEPVCFRSQMDCADECGKTARALRDDEAAWSKAGLIRVTTAANGSRGKFGSLKQGICFSPLIELIPTLLTIKEGLEADRAEKKKLRRLVSGARRIFQVTLGQLVDRCPPEHSDMVELMADYSTLPRRYDGLTAMELSDLLAHVETITHKALSVLDLRSKTSGQAEVSFRPFIQDTTKDSLVICNGSPVDITPPRKRVEVEPSEDAPLGASSCNEKNDEPGQRGHKPDLLESFTPRQVYGACSDDMRFYLDAVKGDRALPNPLDFVNAAERMLPDLGINRSAWADACDMMGVMEAALSVVVIDAGQYRASRPIHSPGGALRAFTRKAKAGQLNLTGSIIGMIDRSRQR